jgi:hypothetical protein
MWREDNNSGNLEDIIRQYGAPNSLFSDNAKSKIRKAVGDNLRMYSINNFQCEPNHQHQHFSERRIQEVKNVSNTLLDRTGSSPYFWLLCVQYLVYVLKFSSSESVQWKTPIEAATGQRLKISARMVFHWYEPVYFQHYKSSSANPSFLSANYWYC